jgi:hypothetical protein
MAGFPPMADFLLDGHRFVFPHAKGRMAQQFLQGQPARILRRPFGKASQPYSARADRVLGFAGGVHEFNMDDRNEFVNGKCASYLARPTI